MGCRSGGAERRPPTTSTFCIRRSNNNTSKEYFSPAGFVLLCSPVLGLRPELEVVTDENHVLD